MKKITAKKVLVAGALLGVLFIPLSVTHAQYYGNQQYPWNNYNSNSWYQNSGSNWYGNYNNSNYSNGYSNGYNNGSNYNNYYGNNSYGGTYTGNGNYNYSQYQPQNLCGPNSSYNPQYNDCDCYSGYVSVNNVCTLPQAVNYGSNYNYNYSNNNYPSYYGFMKAVALCNDGSISYSPVATCWLNRGVSHLLNN